MTSTKSTTQPQPPAIHTSNPALKRLDVLIGEWDVQFWYRSDPSQVVQGQTTFEWLGESFVIQRSGARLAYVPGAIWIIGSDSPGEIFTADYFDSRGVKRVYQMSLSDGLWKIWRDNPGFSQR